MKDFAKFQEKYPLVCLSNSSDERHQVLASSRFPSEVKQDLLYLGNMTNILSKDYAQLKMLKIRTLFYFSPEPFPDIDAHFNCVHIPLKEKERPIIDFDAYSTQIQQLAKE